MRERKRGRPGRYSEQLKQQIGSHILDGLSLHQIAKLPDMPGYRTLMRWMATKPEFKEWVQELQLDAEEERLLRLREYLDALESPEIGKGELKEIGRLMRSFRTITRA